MRKALAVALIFSLLSTQWSVSAAAATQEDYWQVQFTQEQLENLVAPIALYPDPLLAQVLLAATFPDQIDEAAREVRAYGSGANIDAAYWDVSVKSVAHYPTVLSMMADKLDWTTTLGQAYAVQSTDVMAAIQRLRRLARTSGYLVTTAQQQIVDEEGFLYIYPASPRYIYVPTYDPALVFWRTPGPYVTAAIFFGVGLLIGAWLNHDCDWRHHNVYYHGWDRGPVWVTRSRPYIHRSDVYVNTRYRDVYFNRNVVRNPVNYGNLNRYNTVHRDADFNQVRRQRGPGDQRVQGAPPPSAAPAPRPEQHDNKIIRRNIDPNDPRVNANRGRGQLPREGEQAGRTPQPQPGQRDRREEPPRQVTPRPGTQPPQPQAKGPEARRDQPPVTRPETRPPQPQTKGPEARREQPPITRPDTRTQPPAPRQPETPRGPRTETPRPRGPVTTPGAPPTQPAPQPRVSQPAPQPRVSQPAPQPRVSQPAPQPRVAQPAPQPRAQAPRSPEVFRGNRGAIDPGAASNRGQASRQQQNQPVAQPRTPPPQQRSRPGGPPPQQGSQSGQPAPRRR